MQYIKALQFPNSLSDPFLITSPPTTSYNCIAWAFGDSSKWYWPDPLNIYFWPDSIPRLVTLESFELLFRSIGYSVCLNGMYESGFEKIAIYADLNNKPTHAARLLNNGYWTSKLGQHNDVSHTINSMDMGDYGSIRIFMKRSNSNF